MAQKLLKSLILSTVLVSAVFFVVALIAYATLSLLVGRENQLPVYLTPFIAALAACVALAVYIELQVHLVLGSVRNGFQSIGALLERNIELTLTKAAAAHETSRAEPQPTAYSNHND